MRFHCLGIPHTWTAKAVIPCAFTQKVLNFCEMMTKLGHNVFHYGNQMSDVLCTEHITTTTREDMEITYGHKEDGIFYWKREGFEHDSRNHIAQTFTKNAITELRKRIQKDDFILAFWGTGHKPVCDAVSDLPCHVVEPGIGYPHTFSKYRVFESYAKLHLCKGQWDQAGTERYTVPNWTDEVIPNYFNPDDFDYSEDKEDYLFFIGRIINTKGVEIAMRLANHFGMPLKVAGQGDFVRDIGFEPYDCVELLGTVDVEQRKALMSKAKAGVVASWYVEPFAGVHIEFGLSGTPVLTTDWGVFTETVQQGKNGWRCRSFDEFVYGLEHIDEIQPSVCREMAMNYSMDRVALMYHDYFQRLLRHLNAPNFWYLNERPNLDARKRDITPEAVTEQRKDLAPHTTLGHKYHPGGSLAGGDPWLLEQGVWDYCVDTLNVKTVLDIGCGEGHTAKYFAEKGCHVIAMDADHTAIRSAVYPVVYHDLRKAQFSGGAIDMVYMSEFVEHLPEQFLPNLGETLLRTDLVLMTFAPPGAEGIGHINLQTEDYWVDWFAQRGFRKDDGTTQAIRGLAKYVHFQTRGLVFRRVNALQ